MEAISNGITAFKEPRSRNAGITLIWMSLILGTLFLGITFLAGQIGAVPSEEETVISQLARTALVAGAILYLVTIGATTVILIMAANTAFADFPRLSALQAGDGYLPRQLTYRGSRLVFSRGIVLLAVIASLLIIVFHASVTALIPLYAIGVFLSFTLSQGGMARRWWKIGPLKPGEEVKEAGSTLHHDPGWRSKMVVNGFGAVCTVIVMFIFAITKFRDGAWIIMMIMPSLVFIFFRIHHHYRTGAQPVAWTTTTRRLRIRRHRVIVPIAGVHRGTLAALGYARSLSADVTAVHVSIDEAESANGCGPSGERWGDGVRLVCSDSPYRMLLEPLLDYVEHIAVLRQPNEIITLVVPQFVPLSTWTTCCTPRRRCCCAWRCSSRRASSSPTCRTRWSRTSPSSEKEVRYISPDAAPTERPRPTQRPSGRGGCSHEKRERRDRAGPRRHGRRLPGNGDDASPRRHAGQQLQLRVHGAHHRRRRGGRPPRRSRHRAARPRHEPRLLPDGAGTLKAHHCREGRRRGLRGLDGLRPRRRGLRRHPRAS